MVQLESPAPPGDRSRSDQVGFLYFWSLDCNLKASRLILLELSGVTPNLLNAETCRQE
ncbi:hypothetical protein K443DRAFT_349198 [Laccaria amethystina LaAM-08-1]|uniref:Uncharacterized protein n=1 Tax=Laccaria amethystina LaAM-08-1 TaxID=1095629 RepID=A0A0C9XF63_9AGAR|nr:hypothetical protein K443DRAFT_349198 [Laccaria amethystina LaAM-08-1]